MPTVAAHEYTLTAIRAQGAGGQNVNKVASAIHLRFDIHASSLSPAIKARLCHSRDQRVTADGVLVIKAQQYRTQEANRRDAIARLQAMIDAASHVHAVRHATRPTLASRKRRVAGKMQRSVVKQHRGRVVDEG